MPEKDIDVDEEDKKISVIKDGADAEVKGFGNYLLTRKTIYLESKTFYIQHSLSNNKESLELETTIIGKLFFEKDKGIQSIGEDYELSKEIVFSLRGQDTTNHNKKIIEHYEKKEKTFIGSDNNSEEIETSATLFYLDFKYTVEIIIPEKLFQSILKKIENNKDIKLIFGLKFFNLYTDESNRYSGINEPEPLYIMPNEYGSEMIHGFVNVLLARDCMEDRFSSIRIEQNNQKNIEKENVSKKSFEVDYRQSLQDIVFQLSELKTNIKFIRQMLNIAFYGALAIIVWEFLN